MTAKGRGNPRPFQGDSMKHTNLTLYLLCILFASFILLKSRASYGYALPAEEVIAAQAADDYYALRKPLKVIEGGKINTENPKPLFYAPSGTSASLPLAGLVSGAGAIAGLAYYQRTGQDPVYAAANALASAADHVFSPAWQAFKDSVVTPASFPTATEQYLGVEGCFGASVKDFVDFLKGSTSPDYSDIKAQIIGRISPGGLPSTFANETKSAAVVTASDNKNYKIWGPVSTTGMDPNWIPSYWAQGRAKITIAGNEKAGCTIDVTHMWCQNGTSFNGTWMWRVWEYQVEVTTANPTLFPDQDAYDYAGLKADLQPWLAANPAKAHKALTQMEPAQVGVTSNPSPSTAPAQVQPAINGQQVQNFYTNNASQVANYNTTNITNNSTVQDIAKGQAATAAASQSAQKALNDYPKSINFTGSADLPNANQYDPEVTQPEEQNFVNKVHSFLNSGLPVLSAIRSSGLSASGSPRMDTTIWGHPVVIDFSDQQTPIRAAGSVLVIISLILAYLIVVRS